MVIPSVESEKKGLCPFCGGPGSSPEHIFGDWLGREITKPVEAKHYRYAGPRGKATEKMANGLALTGQVKAPCGPCNNGWMSVIENRVKPLLLSMMKGAPQNLDPSQQKALAVWMCVKSMCWERQDEIEKKTIPERDYAFMYLNREPPLWRLPPGWFVWSATSDAPFGQVGAYQSSAIFPAADPITGSDFPMASHSFALVSGCFVGVAFRSPIPGDGGLFSEEGTELFRPLWPLVPEIAWPPPIVVPFKEVWTIPENMLDAMINAWGG